MTGTNDELEKRAKAAYEHLKKEEENKRFLYDKSIGGNAPRPSDQFIQQHVGPLKSHAELQKEARGQAERQQIAQREQARREAEFEQSVREHNRRLEQKQEQEAAARADRQRQNADRFRQAREQARDRGRDRE